MKIALDLQAIQSEGSKNRGIGRYSNELSEQIIELINDEIEILLNEEYKESDGDLPTYLVESKINYYKQLDISGRSEEDRFRIMKINKYLLQEIYSKSDVDLIHIFSAFEGFGGKAVVLDSLRTLNNKVIAVTLYDLIPYLMEDIYLQDESLKKWYYQKMRFLFEADLVLAISESARQDSINNLGFLEDKVVNISGAIDSGKFYKIDNLDIKTKLNLKKKYNIYNKFVMYTGGIDYRKNLENSIIAFSNLDKKIQEDYQFVIVCKINSTQREHFNWVMEHNKIPTKKVIFTDFITDEELNLFYNICDLFIFPSYYEGFGLPVLEAMTCGAPVIASNTSSIPEIVGRNDCLFDPHCTEEITLNLEKALSNSEFLKELSEYLYNRSKMFTWEKSAMKSIEAYADAVSKKEVNNKKRLKIAFFSPLPPIRSGISDYSFELLCSMSKFFDIDLYIDDYDLEASYLKYNFNVYDYRLFRNNSKHYDSIVYQFGNSQYHQYMYDICLEFPGIVVLHDFFLSGLVNFISHTKGEEDFFFDNLKYSHPKAFDKIFNGYKTNNVSLMEILNKYPISKKIIDSAKGVMVHSEYSKKLCSDYYDTDYNIKVLNQSVRIPSLKLISEKSKFKNKLGFQDNNIIISAFGHITETKEYDLIVDVVKENHELQNDNIKIVFVGDFLGESNFKDNIQKDLKELSNIEITKFVSDTMYKDYLIASDIAINLRKDSRGETSRALLMNMSYGLPTIINDYATFAEIPDNCVVKCTLGSKLDFKDKLLNLIQNSKYRKQVGVNAYNHIKKYHNLDQIVEGYYSFISDCLNNDYETIIKDVSKIITDNDIENILTDSDKDQLSECVLSLCDKI